MKKEKFARSATFVQRVVTINAEDATASNRRITKQNPSLFRRNKALEKAERTTIGVTYTAQQQALSPLLSLKFAVFKTQTCAILRSAESETGGWIPERTTKVQLDVMSGERKAASSLMGKKGKQIPEAAEL